jgi:hypothetical protein
MLNEDWMEVVEYFRTRKVKPDTLVHLHKKL